VTKPQLDCKVASMRTGALLEDGSSVASPELFEELAATLPEIFGTVDVGCLERIASRLGAESRTEVFAEVLLLSETYVHVIHPLPKRLGEALLASGPVSRSVGLILSQVHARARALEGEE
jgi:hypothetical protein